MLTLVSEGLAAKMLNMADSVLITTSKRRLKAMQLLTIKSLHIKLIVRLVFNLILRFGQHYNGIVLLFALN